MSSVTSPLWKQFISPDVNFRLAQCNHCGVVVQRGRENAPRAKCYNRNMQKHMGKYHDDLMEEVSKDQEAAKVVTRKVDVRCESVRGTIPIFNLQSQEDHFAFIEKVKL